MLKVRLDAGEDVSVEVKTLLQPAANEYYNAVQAIASHARDRLAADRTAVRSNAAAGQEALFVSALVTLLASMGLHGPSSARWSSRCRLPSARPAPSPAGT